MKRILVILGPIINVAFVLGVLLVAYRLAIPSSEKIFLPGENESHLFIMSVLGLGLVSIFFNYTKHSSAVVSEVVFVDRISETKEVDETHEESEVSHKTDFSTELEGLKVILSGKDEVAQKADRALAMICNTLNIGQGIVFKTINSKPVNSLEICATYAFVSDQDNNNAIKFGEGLVGMAAKENRELFIDDVPDGYITIFSGLGKSSPTHLVILPVSTGRTVTAIIELALFTEVSEEQKIFLNECATNFSILFPAEGNTIEENNEEEIDNTNSEAI